MKTTLCEDFALREEAVNEGLYDRICAAMDKTTLWLVLIAFVLSVTWIVYHFLRQLPRFIAAKSMDCRSYG
jgi:hypothetical protein